MSTRRERQKLVSEYLYLKESKEKQKPVGEMGLA
jgi:hypothetical protein